MATKKFIPAPDNVTNAVGCLTSIGSLAERIDRECYYALGEFSDGSSPTDTDMEQSILLIDRMRDAINRIGWLSDVACKELTGQEHIKGDAVQWLTWPAFAESAAARETAGTDRLLADVQA